MNRLRSAYEQLPDESGLRAEIARLGARNRKAHSLVAASASRRAALTTTTTR